MAVLTLYVKYQEENPDDFPYQKHVYVFVSGVRHPVSVTCFLLFRGFASADGLPASGEKKYYFRLLGSEKRFKAG